MIRSSYVSDIIEIDLHRQYSVIHAKSYIEISWLKQFSQLWVESSDGVVTYSEKVMDPTPFLQRRYESFDARYSPRHFWFHFDYQDHSYKLLDSASTFPDPPPKSTLKTARWSVLHTPKTTREWHLIIPDWFIFGCAAAVFWYSRKNSKREPRPGFCQACGYDLRATPGRCPECGTPGFSIK